MAQDFVLELTPVESSTIERIGYVAASQQLFVKFKSGGVYAYESVPDQVYQEFMAAPSKGRYLHSQIKGRYMFTKHPDTAAQERPGP